MLNPKIRKCLGRIHELYQNFTWGDVFVTSIEEGNHGAGSLHYCGDAFDLRYPEIDIKADVNVRNDLIQKEAGRHFDVVFEQTHIHVEWDPK